MGVRLFVAVWPPAPVAGGVVEALRPALSAAAEAVRVVPAAQLHVTLRFLGEVPDGEVAGVVRAVRDVAWPPATARLAGVTTRMGRGALAVAVDGLDRLGALAGGLQPAGRGGAPEGRPFRGHLTVARTRGRHRLPAQLVGLPVGAPSEGGGRPEGAGLPVGGRWPVGEVTLVRSRLGRAGPSYEVLERTPVRG